MKFYHNLTPEQKQDHQEVVRILSERYNLSAQKWLRKTRAYTIQQTPTQTVADYAKQSFKRFDDANELNEETKIHLFIKGLKKSLRTQVFLQRPRTLSEAHEIASVCELSQAMYDDSDAAPPKDTTTSPRVNMIQLRNDVQDIRKDLKNEMRQSLENMQRTMVNAITEQNQSAQDQWELSQLQSEINQDRIDGQYPSTKDMNGLQQTVNSLRQDIAALMVKKTEDGQRDIRQLPFCELCQQPGHSQLSCELAPRLPPQRCYYCSRVGHIARFCEKKARDNRMGQRNPPRQDQNQRRVSWGWVNQSPTQNQQKSYGPRPQNRTYQNDQFRSILGPTKTKLPTKKGSSTH